MKTNEDKTSNTSFDIFIISSWFILFDFASSYSEDFTTVTLHSILRYKISALCTKLRTRRKLPNKSKIKTIIRLQRRIFKTFKCLRKRVQSQNILNHNLQPMDCNYEIVQLYYFIEQ